MPFSVYDAQGVRLLTALLAEVLAEVQLVKPGPDPLRAARARLIVNLSKAYDAGERRHAALKTAAMKGVYVAPQKKTS